jgi:hypothetical protein
MHDTMGRPPTHPKRLLLAVSDEGLEQVDAWRRRQVRIPNQSEAIRRLVEIGLTTKPVKPKVRLRPPKPANDRFPRPRASPLPAKPRR